MDGHKGGYPLSSKAYRDSLDMTQTSTGAGSSVKGSTARSGWQTWRDHVLVVTREVGYRSTAEAVPDADRKRVPPQIQLIQFGKL